MPGDRETCAEQGPCSSALRGPAGHAEGRKGFRPDGAAKARSQKPTHTVKVIEVIAAGVSDGPVVEARPQRASKAIC